MYSWNRKEIEDNILNLVKYKDPLYLKTLESYEQILKKLQEKEYDSKEYIMTNALIRRELENLKNYQETYPNFFDKKIIFIQQNVRKLKYTNIKDERQVIKNEKQIIDIIYEFIISLDKEYKKILEDLINTNSIYIKKTNTDTQTFTLNDTLNEKIYIYSTSDNSIKDIYKLLHEIFHAIQIKKQNIQEDEFSELTNETIPLLSSFLLTDYLKNYDEEKYKEKNLLFKNIITLSQINTKKINILKNNIITKTNIENDVLSTDYIENTKYIFSYFLAFELYKKYKEHNRFNLIKKFIENSIQDFNDTKKYDIDFFDIASEKSRKQIKIYIKKPSN